MESSSFDTRAPERQSITMTRLNTAGQRLGGEAVEITLSNLAGLRAGRDQRRRQRPVLHVGAVPTGMPCSAAAVLSMPGAVQRPSATRLVHLAFNTVALCGCDTCVGPWSGGQRV